MRRRWIIWWAAMVLGALASAAGEARRLSSEEAMAWLNEFGADHQARGTAAFLDRIDEERLRERAEAASGLTGERRRHEAFTRQTMRTLRSEFAGMKDLRLGRRMDEGDHWSVMAYFSDPAGLFIFRRLRIERVDEETTRITDWADMPCDVGQSEMIAALVLVQTLTPPDRAPEALRAELKFYHENPQRYVRAAMMAGRMNAEALALELIKLPPEARFGVLAREWRTALLGLYAPERFLIERELFVGPPDKDPMRGLLLFRAGVRGNDPEVALEGLAQLGGQLGHDLNIRMEKGAMLILAGRDEEALQGAIEATELYPTDYAMQVHRVTAVRLAGDEADYEAERKRLRSMLGDETAKAILRSAELYLEDMKNRRREIDALRMARTDPKVPVFRVPTFSAPPLRMDFDHAPLDLTTP